MINEATRRNIFDIIRVEKLAWSGKLDETEFLARIFDLESMPSYDSRYKTAARDIWQHRVNNPDDWNDDWVFSDKRFNLLRCDDIIFLKFLCEMLHPVVRDDKEETERLQQAFNEYLRDDGYEIYQSKFISGHPVYSSRHREEANNTPSKNSNLDRESSLKLSRPLRVFLCHASGDKPAVRKLYDRLLTNGVDAWLDEKKLIPGQQWQIEIPKAVVNSDIVIVCLSSQSITKEGFVQKEIRLALDSADEKPDETIFIIPARLENCDVPERIKRYHWVDLFLDDGYGRLLQALQIRAKSLGIGLQSSNKDAKTKTVSSELWKETIDEIVSLPNIYDASSRQVILLMAFGNDPINYSIDISGSPLAFANNLLDVLVSYLYLENGKLAIIEILDYTRKNLVGVDRAERITKLLEKWKLYYEFKS